MVGGLHGAGLKGFAEREKSRLKAFMMGSHQGVFAWLSRSGYGTGDGVLERDFSMEQTMPYSLLTGDDMWREKRSGHLRNGSSDCRSAVIHSISLIIGDASSEEKRRWEQGQQGMCASSPLTIGIGAAVLRRSLTATANHGHWIRQP